MSVAGRGVGVLHSVSDPDEGSESDVELMEVIARRAGDRIGLLRALAQSQTEAKTDPLTGLPNRRTLQEELGRLLDRQQDLALVYADLDQFKRVNDEFGHKAGDRALRVFARTLLTSVREDDLVARWGGEEFVIAFIDCDAQQASSRIEQIQAALSQALSDADTPSFTCSFGIADTSQSFDAETLLAQADEALLEAKRRGRDRMLVGSWQGPFDLEEWGRLIRDDGDGRPA
jgi:diguanylate cyclase (GGDEF)-like protein